MITTKKAGISDRGVTYDYVDLRTTQHLLWNVEAFDSENVLVWAFNGWGRLYSKNVPLGEFITKFVTREEYRKRE